MPNDVVSVENGTDVILTLLYAGGSRKKKNEEIVGNTRLDKLVFLAEQETSLKSRLRDVSFEPYNFGPYSAQVFDSIQALIDAGLVKAETREMEAYLDEADRYQLEEQAGEGPDTSRSTRIYSLTTEGEQVGAALFDSLGEDERKELVSLKERFNTISLKRLLQYVYHQYPSFTTESVIKDTIS